MTAPPMSTALDFFLRRLEGVVADEGCWQATCPACGSERPGLRVYPGEGGFVRFRCYADASCRSADVLAAMNLRWSDLDPRFPVRA